jgi:uncharacterized protein YodC (DUF2158 family)
MATMFKKGELVQVKAVNPEGNVQALRMLDDGTVQCMLTWVDASGKEQSRWFDETDLQAV